MLALIKRGCAWTLERREFCYDKHRNAKLSIEMSYVRPHRSPQTRSTSRCRPEMWLELWPSSFQGWGWSDGSHAGPCTSDPRRIRASPSDTHTHRHAHKMNFATCFLFPISQKSASVLSATVKVTLHHLCSCQRLDNLTSEPNLNWISYMRMRPLGWLGSGQRRNTQSLWPSQVTGPGMSSAFSGEPRGE